MIAIDLDGSPVVLHGRMRPGDGDGILWLHGYTLDSSVWEPLWERLPGFRHVAIDLPGHGSSDPIRREMSLPWLAWAIGEHAREERIAHLVGMSFGAMLALQVAVEHPGAFATVTLASPPLADVAADPVSQGHSRALTRLYRARGPGPWMTRAWMDSPAGIFAGAAARPELWKSLEAVVARHRWDELGDRAMQTLSAHAQPDPVLRGVGAATLVLVGERDMPHFKRCAELIRRSIPGARRVYVPSAAHMCLLEEPDVAGDLFRRHVREAK